MTLSGSAPPPTDGTPLSDANIDDDPSAGLRDVVNTMEEMEAKIKEDAERVRNDVNNLASTIRDINSRFEHVSLSTHGSAGATRRCMTDGTALGM